MLLMGSNAFGQLTEASASFPLYLGDDFDYSTFTRFDAPGPPKSLIYQSNGFMALQERGFGTQRIIIPVAGTPAPTNESERLLAIDVDAPVFIDSSSRTYKLSDSP